MDIVNILVAEDEFIVASDIKLRLKSLGYNIVGLVSKGEDAVSKASDLKPDLILMDVMLQGKLDGIEAAKEIHKNNNIPIIFLTASTDESTLDRAKEAHPYGFILKPFEARELHTTIEIAIYRHQMEIQLKQSEERFKALVENSSDAISLTDENGIYTYSSDSVKRILGHESEFLIGKNLWDFIYEEDREELKSRYAHLLQNPLSSFSMQYRVIHKDSSIRWIETVNTNLLNNNSIKSIVSNFRDITEKKKTEDRMHYLSFYDQMTGLPNKALLMDRLSLAIAGAKRNNNIIAVLFIDLDYFKKINDTYGHNAGDFLIVEFSKRLLSSVRETDTVSRRSSDEFVVITPDIKSKEDVEIIIEKIIDNLKVPFVYNNENIDISVSIGISMYPYDSDNSEDLISLSDSAMYEAKKKSNFSYVFYKKGIKLKK